MRDSLVIGIMAMSIILVRTEPVVVSGKANPWLSGMPTGSTASKCIDTAPDTAPAQSPVQVATIRVYQGQSLTFFASGAVSHDSSGAVRLSPPDGKPSVVLNHEPGAQNGIGNITAPIDSLIGVFLGPEIPSRSPAPAALNFSTAASRDYSRLTPVLKQPFFIGNGRTSAQKIQLVVVPPGATRLFLGVMDGCGWSSNRGSFTAAVADLAPTLLIRVSEVTPFRQVEICWPSVQNVRYQVQIRAELSTGQWSNLGDPIVGSGLTDCISDTITLGQQQRLYRVSASVE